jgi:hypothetical protein
MKSFNLTKSAILLLTTLCISITFLKAQPVVDKEITLNGFSQIYVTTGIELIITQGNTESAKIVTTDNLIDAVVVEQTGSKVNVSWKPIRSTKKAWLQKTAKVYLNYKTLALIDVSDGSALKTTNSIKTNSLEAAVASGAIITAQLDCGGLNLKTSSGASATLAGTVKNMELTSSSGSLINAFDLVAEQANITASSGADVKVNALKTIAVSSQSGAKVRYKGNATLNDHSAGKSGSVKKVN